MNAKSLKAVWALGLVLVAAACSGKMAVGDTAKATMAGSGASMNDPAVRQTIDSADRKFEIAFKNGDAAAAASLYEENATSHGSYINYWRKQSDGSWKIHRDAIVSANPLPNMGPPPAKK